MALTRLLRRSFGGGRRVVTLTLEQGAVRVLVTAGNTVQKWAAAPMALNAYAEGVVQSPELVGAVIATLFAQEKIAKQDVVTCLSGARSLYRTFTLPPTRPQDLAPAIRYQAKREMPLPEDDLLLVWQVLNSNPQHHEVFAVGTSRDVANRLMEALRYAGLRLKTIDMKPLALARVAGEPNAMVLNIGRDNLHLVYLRDDIPAITRSIFFSDAANSTPMLVDRLVNEISMSIRSYNDSYVNAPVVINAPIYLCCTVGDYQQLAAALSASLGRAIERINPPLRYPPEFPLEEFATNVGLALRRS